MIALNIAASLDYDIDIFDVTAAFLEAFLDRKVLVRIDHTLTQALIEQQPELRSGLLPDGSLIVQLKKALYGLRDAPSSWWKTLEGVPTELGFKSSDHDKCLFIRARPQKDSTSSSLTWMT